MYSNFENSELFNNDSDNLFPYSPYIFCGNCPTETNLNEELDSNIFESMDFSDKNEYEQYSNSNVGKTTSFQTNLKKSLKIEDKNSFLYFNDIQDILDKNKIINNEIKDKLIYEKNIINEENYLLYKKRKRDNDLNIKKDNSNIFFEDEKENSKKIKKGRKIKNNSSNGREEHDKNSPDNIIKNIKAKLFNYCLNFLNNVINGNSDKKKQRFKLLKLNYEYIDRLKRDIDLELLETPLKNIFSLNISTKYRAKHNDHNKNIISEILNEKNKETKLYHYNTVKFVFDLTFGEWLDLFTFKINLDRFYNYEYEDVKFGKIKENINGLSDLLNKIAKNKKNKKEYFSLYVFYLYNYERFFMVKSPRIVKK